MLLLGLGMKLLLIALVLKYNANYNEQLNVTFLISV